MSKYIHLVSYSEVYVPYISYLVDNQLLYMLLINAIGPIFCPFLTVCNLRLDFQQRALDNPKLIPNNVSLESVLHK